MVPSAKRKTKLDYYCYTSNVTTKTTTTTTTITTTNITTTTNTTTTLQLFIKNIIIMVIK